MARRLPQSRWSAGGSASACRAPGRLPPGAGCLTRNICWRRQRPACSAPAQPPAFRRRSMARSRRRRRPRPAGEPRLLVQHRQVAFLLRARPAEASLPVRSASAPPGDSRRAPESCRTRRPAAGPVGGAACELPPLPFGVEKIQRHPEQWPALCLPEQTAAEVSQQPPHQPGRARLRERERATRFLFFQVAPGIAASAPLPWKCCWPRPARLLETNKASSSARLDSAFLRESARPPDLEQRARNGRA